ncbi:MAG TPA: family 20 glycosylhydrolase [Phycisphaerales bacterium]|nr:family 20 glycosylhydrolase [Phycisphaerales bacterium]
MAPLAPPLLVPRPHRIELRGQAIPFPCAIAFDPSFSAHPGAAETARRIFEWAGLDRLLAPRGKVGNMPVCITPRADSPNPESYHLSIDPTAITITPASAAALRHAIHTLVQLLRQYQSPAQLPILTIHDTPAVPIRGVMLDISRDKILTMASLREAIDLFAHLKINHLQLYTEHAFAYTGHEEVWRGCDPITPAEARELDTYARERGIELAANQNTLGHLHRWLNHPRYAPLAEITGDWMFETDDGRRVPKSGPFSLCPTDPRSIELIRDLLDQLLPNSASPMCNIGLDEAYDVGQEGSRSRDRVARDGSPGPLFFEHFSKVDAIVRSHGKRSLFWADIALKYPHLLNQLPAGAEALIWGYEANAPFDRHARTLRHKNIPFWTCPGTSSWLTITGRTNTRRANIDAAVRAAVEQGAQGVLLTNWGDRGHRQQWPIELHSIASGAAAMWSGGSTPDDPRAVGLHIFNDPAPASAPNLGDWLDELGDVDADLRTHLRNTSALFVELHKPLRDPITPAETNSPAAWQDVESRLAQLAARFNSLKPTLDPLTISELDHTLRVATLAARRAIIRRSTSPSSPDFAQASQTASAELRFIIQEQRALWTRRNRPGGLADSAAHYESILSADA